MSSIVRWSSPEAAVYYQTQQEEVTKKEQILEEEAAQRIVELRASLSQPLNHVSNKVKKISIRTFYPAGTSVFYKGKEGTIQSWIGSKSIKLTRGDITSRVPFKRIVPKIRKGETVLVRKHGSKQLYFPGTCVGIAKESFAVDLHGTDETHPSSVSSSTSVRFKPDNVCRRILPLISELSPEDLDQIQIKNRGNALFPVYRFDLASETSHLTN